MTSVSFPNGSRVSKYAAIKRLSVCDNKTSSAPHNQDNGCEQSVFPYGLLS